MKRELTFINLVPIEKGKPRKAQFQCHCGKLFFAIFQNVKSGNTSSCGCVAKSKKKLTDSDVVIVRRLLSENVLTLREIGEIFNVHLVTIFNIKMDKIYKNENVQI